MAVHIRLKRMGAKKRPFYRIVAADSRRARDGRFLEVLGTYNPITNPAVVKIHEDKLTNWLNEGAQPSDTVGSLLTQIGFIEKYEKGKRGEDISDVQLKEHIIERKKKTRKMKKAILAAAEEAKVAEETAATEKKKKEEEAKAEKEKAEKAAEASSEESAE